jgi:hypothetical protein
MARSCAGPSSECIPGIPASHRRQDRRRYRGFRGISRARGLPRQAERLAGSWDDLAVTER